MKEVLAWLIAFVTSFSALQAPIPPQPQQTTMILTGDVMLGRTVMTTSLDKNDPTYPFSNVADTLKSADLTFINLENPITQGCPRHYDGFKFCADPKMIEGLTYSGVDVVTLANNHSKNYGDDGVAQSQKLLSNAGIDSTGTGNLVTREVNGTRFGFLGFEKSQQSNPRLTTHERSLIIESNKKVDVLIVAMHWGVEYQNKALPGVRTLAREIVDLGADVIVGSHPHWVQDWETINGVPVYYSLGNFVFDQMWSENTKKGLAVKVTFENKKILKQDFMPTYMKNHAQPEFVVSSQDINILSPKL